VLIAKIRLSLEANGLSSVFYLSGFRLDKGRAWRRGLRLQVVPTIPSSNDDFRSENLSCSCRCRFLWQARPQELALRSSPNLLEDGILSNFVAMNIFVSSNKISFCGFNL